MSKSILYLECSSGISGDMTVAALLDLGADRKVLTDALASLPLSGYQVEIKDVYKSAIRACDFAVVMDAAHETHDHDMDYLYGTGTLPAQEHHPHHHEARNLSDITKIIRAGDLSEGARDLAIRIFTILAEAESKAHGKPIEKVHFHEVGAVDSIVDIVAAAVCLDNLHPDEVAVSTLTEGCGQIRCQHGLMPVPVPAVAQIASSFHLPLRLTDIEGELVTPTGAAIAAAVRTRDKLPEEVQIRRIGLGAGKREYAASGILRAIWCEKAGQEADLSAVSSSAEEDTVLVLETNLDDCSGEALSYTMQKLLEAGALDVFYVPVYMKKNRPGTLLTIICSLKDRAVMEAVLFQNTTTIGIRRQEMRRTKLARRTETLETPWGRADIKCITYEGETRYYPENDSVQRLAGENGTGFSDLYALLQDYARRELSC